MGEIDKNTQGTPSEKEAPPGGSEETTPKKEAKTHTEAEVNKAVQVALTKAGRDDKVLTDKEAALNTQQEAINARQAEIDEQERQRDAAELVAAKGDPDLLRVYQDKQVQKREVAGITALKADLKRQQAEIDRSKAEHEVEIKAAREATMERKIFEIAAEEEVDPMDIKKAMEELNLTTVEQAKSVAKRLAAKKPETTKTKITVDSGVTSGGKKSSEGKPARQVFADYFRDQEKK